MSNSTPNMEEMLRRRLDALVEQLETHEAELMTGDYRLLELEESITAIMMGQVSSGAAASLTNELVNLLTQADHERQSVRDKRAYIARIKEQIESTQVCH